MRLLLALLALPLITGCATDHDPSLRVMTFNIRFDNPADGPSAWPHRAAWVAEVIERESPDVLGLQEALRHQVDTLAARLPGYRWIGGGRDDGNDAGEFAPLFVRTSRFEIAEWGLIWLSADPDSVGSVGWDAALTRVATWADLMDRSDGRHLRVVNTHFDHRGEEARLQSALLLRDRYLSAETGAAVVLTGDLNLSPEAPGYAVLSQAATDAWGAPIREGPEATWSGFLQDGSEGDRIDYVFVDGPLAPTNYRVLEESRNGRYVSDHRPVVADIAWPVDP